MNVILLGPPGAGKGTQAALLAEGRGVAKIATGDLLRDAVRRGTRLGEQAKTYMDAGELVPDELILGLVREVLAGGGPGAELPVGRGFVLDGFPRTLAQAEALDELLDELERSLDAVVVIDVPDDELVRRLTGRRTCAECGETTNVHSDAPERPGKCDACGGTLERRSDDDAATVRHRLEVYRERTAPLVAYYTEGETPLHRVDGDRSIDDVRGAIRGALAPDRSHR